jgi:hypothetical protein
MMLVLTCAAHLFTAIGTGAMEKRDEGKHARRTDEPLYRERERERLGGTVANYIWQLKRVVHYREG